MKKILVDIYLAFNLGDDMFLDVLSKRYPNDEITLIYPGNDYNTFIKKYKNVKKMSYPLFYKILRKFHIYNVLEDYGKMAEEFDVLLFLGGGIFREEKYSEPLLDYRQQITSSFQQKNKKTFFLGCSFGPYTSKEFYNSYFQLFKMCDDVCFRDLYSYNLFKNLKNVRYAPDILWSYKIDIQEQKDNTIGYSIINPMHKFGLSQYFDAYVEYTKESIIENINKGFKINLLSFCEVEGDKFVINEILKTIPEELRSEIITTNYDGDIEGLLFVISKLKCIVAARFHAVLLGLLNEIEVIPIIYSNKTKNLLLDVKFNGTIVEFDNLNIFERKLCNSSSLEVSTSITESTSHFTILDGCLIR